DYTDDLKNLLAHYNLASKEWVIRQYDHEVQAGSVLKPLVGIDNDAPGDAAVIRPRLNSDRAIAIGCGICPQYSDIDPYAMATAAIDEALRNIIAVGANPQKIAILDNFCWGNCDNPETLGALVKAAQGCYDAAIAFGTPFISGKDSLNNEFQTADGHTISIPHTLLISAVGIVEDANRCVSMDAKQPGNIILILGLTKNELGASHYYKIHNQLGANVPRVDLKAAAATFKALAQAIRQRLVRSCHDCSEGGLAVALAEMAFAGKLGMDIHLHTTPLDKTITRNDQILFSESPSRFIVEIEPQNLGRFARLCSNIRFAQIGKITNDSRLTIKDPQHKTIIDAELDDLKNAWKKTFQW
ncbi:MAG: phosphoribosylformylglycinamidine synthase, partial [Planctomycetes bacterium]|nr:phosphoribosylformylglycinamidine synthase [Planctomycetota bacterium]